VKIDKRPFILAILAGLSWLKVGEDKIKKENMLIAFKSYL
jgi:hypothetical protein